MVGQVFSVGPEDVATVGSGGLLAGLELEVFGLILREREGFTGLDMWSVLVVQLEQPVISRLMAGEGQGAQAGMEGTDG